jgi:hypothetical protein
VKFPHKDLTAEECFFFSGLPQALSTEAEMMTRYNSGEFDGKTSCLQRIHVTGGTNGILIQSLRKFRPFTPTFIGRAEDQAYLLPVLGKQVEGQELRYYHQSGLIMRHDKEAFAQEAIQTAAVGKIVGDYIRILFFSKYVQILSEKRDQVKALIDPFTGCFASHLPFTIVYLRLALKTASFFAHHQQKQALELITEGIPRIEKAIGFIQNEDSQLEKNFRKEKQGWEDFYNLLDHLEKSLELKAENVLALQKKARLIIQNCQLHS